MKMDEYADDWETPYYIVDENEQSASLHQIYKYCLEPTLHEVVPLISKLLLTNFLFRLVTQNGVISKNLCHVFSAICGLIVFYALNSSVIIISSFILAIYILLIITYSLNKEDWKYYICILCIGYLVVSEFCFPLPDIWNETRGIHMIAAMKAISIIIDIDKGILQSFPNVFEYFGYMLCPSNCLFGPWVSFNSYKSVFYNQSPLLHFDWLKKVIIATLISIVFLTVSNCWAYYLIPQDLKWSVAYQEAFSVRSSHYFISYLAQAAMLVGGFGYFRTKKGNESHWNITITKPLSIEFPRSLVQVVVCWNIPIHMWLKNYVFHVCKPKGTFFAVIMTYVISSVLHGFNLKLAAVLLSLGFYTYIEYRLRHKLSLIFNACIGANLCKKCDHIYKNNTYVWLVNFMFTALAVFHLAYLGCLLDISTHDVHESNIFDKWRKLDFASHLCTVFLYVIYKLI